MLQVSLIAQKIHIEGLPQIDLGQPTLRSVLATVFLVAGGMAVLYLLIGAVRFAISGGDPGQTKQARDTILYALIGIVVSTSAFLIVQFILGSVIS